MGCGYTIFIISGQDQNEKSNLHDTRGITLKRVTSARAHLRHIATGQHRNIAAMASRWRQRMI